MMGKGDSYRDWSHDNMCIQMIEESMKKIMRSMWNNLYFGTTVTPIRLPDAQGLWN